MGECVIRTPFQPFAWQVKSSFLKNSLRNVHVACERDCDRCDPEKTEFPVGVYNQACSCKAGHSQFRSRESGLRRPEESSGPAAQAVCSTVSSQLPRASTMDTNLHREHWAHALSLLNAPTDLVIKPRALCAILSAVLTMVRVRFVPLFSQLPRALTMDANS